MSQFQNAQFYSSSRRAKIITTGIHLVSESSLTSKDYNFLLTPKSDKRECFGIGSYDISSSARAR